MEWISGNKVIDAETGVIEEITNTTSNSIEVTQTKLSEKGINCKNWFEYSKFVKRFSPPQTNNNAR